jgi:hypothetical protein
VSLNLPPPITEKPLLNWSGFSFFEKQLLKKVYILQVNKAILLLNNFRTHVILRR